MPRTTLLSPQSITLLKNLEARLNDVAQSGQIDGASRDFHNAALIFEDLSVVAKLHHRDLSARPVALRLPDGSTPNLPRLEAAAAIAEVRLADADALAGHSAFGRRSLRTSVAVWNGLVGRVLPDTTTPGASGELLREVIQLRNQVTQEIATALGLDLSSLYTSTTFAIS